MTAEEERTRLIGEIARVLRDGPVPEEARAAALTFIGWLARRMPGEPVSLCDVSRCTGRHEGDLRPASAPPTPAPAANAGSTPAPPVIEGAQPSKTSPPGGYEGPPSGAKPRTPYMDGSEYEASHGASRWGEPPDPRSGLPRSR